MLGDMIKGFVGNLVNKKVEIIKVLKTSLKTSSIELNGGKPSEFFYMITPKGDNMSFHVYLYKIENGKQVFVRKMAVAEILGEKITKETQEEERIAQESIDEE